LINGIPRDPDADNLQSKTPRQRRSESRRNVPRLWHPPLYTHYLKSPDRRATQDTEKLNRPSSPHTKVSSSALPRSQKTDTSPPILYGTVPESWQPRRLRLVDWSTAANHSRPSSISTAEYPPGLSYTQNPQNPNPEDPPHSKSCCGANGGCVVQRSKQQHC
jgi:hypothetical protein